MVQNCRVQMTRSKNIHESPVQAPCKLKTDIFVKLGRVDIKRCCPVLNGVYEQVISLRRQHQTKVLAER